MGMNTFFHLDGAYYDLAEGPRGVVYLTQVFTVGIQSCFSSLRVTGYLASYDYGSAIAENRELTDKYPELKRQGLFLRSSPEFYKTDYIGDSTGAAVAVTNDSAFVTLLTNPDTSTSFFIARQKDSTST